MENEIPKALKAMKIRGMEEMEKEHTFLMFQEQQKIMLKELHPKEYRGPKKKKKLKRVATMGAMAMMRTLRTILDNKEKVGPMEIMEAKDVVHEMYITENYSNLIYD